jgi:hypothetical protein
MHTIVIYVATLVYTCYDIVLHQPGIYLLPEMHLIVFPASKSEGSYEGENKYAEL